MLDNITIDQLRVFIAAAEEGSFSAAGRKLHKVQSAISYAISNLEENLGVHLFDRSKRSPQLTIIGEQMLKRANIILAQVEQLHIHAHSLHQGMETDLSICIDSMFPLNILPKVCSEFKFVFPNIPLNIYTEHQTTIKERIQKQTCHLGFICSTSELLDPLVSKKIGTMNMTCVASPKHELSQKKHILSTDLLDELHIQVKASESKPLKQSQWSNRSWTLNNFICQRELLKSGIGWGLVPKHLVTDDLKLKSLIELDLEDLNPDISTLPIMALCKKDAPLGPSAIWLLEKMEHTLNSDKII